MAELCLPYWLKVTEDGVRDDVEAAELFIGIQCKGDAGGGFSVKRWFRLTTQQVIGCGLYLNVKEPTRKINAFVQHSNEHDGLIV